MTEARAIATLRSLLTQGGSPVREIRSPGSVRGAVRKDRPYRDPRAVRAFGAAARKTVKSGGAAHRARNWHFRAERGLAHA